MRIATWNVNSIRQRLELLLAWLKECSPDIVCLQEIKCTDDAFPRLEIEALGYNVVTHGQKTFNGVALLSKLPFDETKSGLAGDDEDAHARFLEGVVPTKGGVLRIACLYLPNGNPADSDKYPYKLKWMSRLLEYSRQRLKAEEPLILAGDFNVIPAADGRLQPAGLGQRRAVPPHHPRKLPGPARPWPDGRAARGHRRAGAIHLLGLSGRRLAEELGPAHRPSPDVAAGQRPADRCRRRFLCARLGEAVRPRAGLGGPRSRGGVNIRDATAADAAAACEVLRASIAELCIADHRNDPDILGRWLANKTPENVARWAADPVASLLLAVRTRTCSRGGSGQERRRNHV